LPEASLVELVQAVKLSNPLQTTHHSVAPSDAATAKKKPKKSTLANMSPSADATDLMSHNLQAHSALIHLCLYRLDWLQRVSFGDLEPRMRKQKQASSDTSRSNAMDIIPAEAPTATAFHLSRSARARETTELITVVLDAVPFLRSGNGARMFADRQ